jgi:hypothetical protein
MEVNEKSQKELYGGVIFFLVDYKKCMQPKDLKSKIKRNTIKDLKSKSWAKSL